MEIESRADWWKRRRSAKEKRGGVKVRDEQRLGEERQNMSLLYEWRLYCLYQSQSLSGSFQNRIRELSSSFATIFSEQCFSNGVPRNPGVLQEIAKSSVINTDKQAYKL